MQLLLISLGILIVFVLITLAEAWFVKHKLGLDVVADIKATFDSGKFAKGVVKASGVIAFVIVQPFFLTALLGRISDTVGTIIIQAGLRTLTAIGGSERAVEVFDAMREKI